MMLPWRPLVLGLAGGMLGVALALLVWHLWGDHVLLHQVVLLLNQQAAAASAK